VALGVYNALSQAYRGTGQQRCWVHHLRNVLDKLPDRQKKKAKELLRQAMYAGCREAAQRTRAAFGTELGAQREKAVRRLEGDGEDLLTPMEFPVAGYPRSEWRLHLRTSNVIETVFSPATVRAKKAKGAGSRTPGLALGL
jgi:transposase-like protein